MFQFTLNVKLELFLAGLWLALTIFGEILIANQFRHMADAVQGFTRSGDKVAATTGPATQVIPATAPTTEPAAAIHSGIWQWLWSADPDVTSLRHAVAIFALLVGFYCIVRYFREVSNSYCSMRMVFYIREAIYDKLQRVGFGFHDALSTGQLINRALGDLQNVRQFLMVSVLTSLDILLIVVGYIAMLMTRHWLIGVLALLPLPLWVWYILRFSKRVQPLQKSVMEAQDKNISILSENIQGVHVVKAFATEQLEIGKYNKNTDNFFTRVLTRIRAFADFLPVIRGIATVSHLGLFAATAWFVLHGQLTVGDFMFISVAMGSILGRLQQVQQLNEQYQMAMVSSRRLYEVLSAPPTVPEVVEAKPLPPGPGTVRFEDVTFGYSADKPVLKNLTFEIPGGSIVAIVGPTGAGKTSLVNLISRFYDPQSGTVYIDGQDVKASTLSSIRTQVALVFQETYLFSDTIEANIAYGRPGVRGGEVEAAARLAQAHDFIDSLPRGYQTILAERGSSLSGGQRQRLAIARAILFNPRILILDDATASVDPETEDLIQRALNFIMKGKTTFLIAHRISTVKRADMVIVLENGRISQMGTHEELMRASGHYREIAEVQLYGDGEEVPPGSPDHPSVMKRHQPAPPSPAPQPPPQEATP